MKLAGLELSSEIDKLQVVGLEKGKTRAYDRFPGCNLGQTILSSLKSTNALFRNIMEERVALVTGWEADLGCGRNMTCGSKRLATKIWNFGQR